MSEIHGHADEHWGKVADAFRTNFEQHSETGAACALYADGKLVVDLWGGIADREPRRPWQEDTVVLVWSTTKGATAVCAHILAERGDLDLDAPVTRYWPEFGRNGKENIPVRWLLSHQAGLPVIDAQLTLEEACEWEPVIRALEAQTPLWAPGTQRGYHAKTYGFLVGEVVRRISGKTLGAFFADEVARPLGLNAWIGLPEEIEPRVALLELAAPPPDPAAWLESLGLDPAAASKVAAWQETIADPNSWVTRSFTLGEAFPPFADSLGVYNSRILRAAEHPGSNMVSDARSVARMYASTVCDVDGIRLLGPKTVEEMTVVQTSETTPYGVPPQIQVLLGAAFTQPYSLGFQTPSPLMPLLGARSFGHAGAGGSLGFADPDHRIGFGYAMNHMSYDSRRTANLVSAISQGIGLN